MWKSKANWKDPNWKYVSAASTDVSKTIEKVKHQVGNTAFPFVSAETFSIGMTLRDYFAAKAMQGLLAQSQGTALGSAVEAAADYAYVMADAMLKAREE